MSDCVRGCGACRYLAGAPPETVCLHGDYLGWATEPEQPVCSGRAFQPVVARPAPPVESAA